MWTKVTDQPKQNTKLIRLLKTGNTHLRCRGRVVFTELMVLECSESREAEDAPRRFNHLSFNKEINVPLQGFVQESCDSDLGLQETEKGPKASRDVHTNSTNLQNSWWRSAPHSHTCFHCFRAGSRAVLSCVWQQFFYTLTCHFIRYTHSTAFEHKSLISQSHGSI